MYQVFPLKTSKCHKSCRLSALLLPICSRAGPVHLSCVVQYIQPVAQPYSIFAQIPHQGHQPPEVAHRADDLLRDTLFSLLPPLDAACRQCSGRGHHPVHHAAQAAQLHRRGAGRSAGLCAGCCRQQPRALGRDAPYSAAALISCEAANRRNEKKAFSEAASFFPFRLPLRGLKGASRPFLVPPAPRK